MDIDFPRDHTPLNQRVPGSSPGAPTTQSPETHASKSASGKAAFCGYFPRVVVSNLWSLFGDIASSALFARLSPAAKIPFQTRIGQADRKSARDHVTCPTPPVFRNPQLIAR
jgi:hypothetical protein